jgi:hypothetical protein
MGPPKNLWLRREGKNTRSDIPVSSFLGAILEVISGNISKRAAAIVYGITCSTLKGRIGKKWTRESAGWATVVSEDEEMLTVGRLFMQGEWGFPLPQQTSIISSRTTLTHRDKPQGLGRKGKAPILCTVSWSTPFHFCQKAKLIKRSRSHSRDSARVLH